MTAPELLVAFAVYCILLLVITSALWDSYAYDVERYLLLSPSRELLPKVILACAAFAPAWVAAASATARPLRVKTVSQAEIAFGKSSLGRA